jgi:hypothetical protein
VAQFESTNRRAASLLAEPVLVVKQKLKLVELRNEYGVFDPDGRQIGHIVKQIRLGKARFALLDPGGAQLGEVRTENWRAKGLQRPRRRRPGAGQGDQAVGRAARAVHRRRHLRDRGAPDRR